jgi:hypothetical protein
LAFGRGKEKSNWAERRRWLAGLLRPIRQQGRKVMLGRMETRPRREKKKKKKKKEIGRTGPN